MVRASPRARDGLSFSWLLAVGPVALCAGIVCPEPADAWIRRRRDRAHGSRSDDRPENDASDSGAKVGSCCPAANDASTGDTNVPVDVDVLVSVAVPIDVGVLVDVAIPIDVGVLVDVAVSVDVGVGVLVDVAVPVNVGVPVDVVVPVDAAVHASMRGGVMSTASVSAASTSRVSIGRCAYCTQKGSRADHQKVLVGLMVAFSFGSGSCEPGRNRQPPH